MLSRISFAATAAIALLIVATPAFAMKGREALAKCDANPKCHAYVDEDGFILIFGPEGGATATCQDLHTECEAQHRTVASTTPGGSLSGGGGTGATAGKSFTLSGVLLPTQPQVHWPPRTHC